MKYFLQVEENLVTTEFLTETIEAHNHDSAIRQALILTCGQVLHVWSSFQNKQPLARIAIVRPNRTFQRLQNLEAF